MFFAQLAIGVTHPHRRLCSCLSWCDDGDNGQKDAVYHKLRHMNANALLLPHPAVSALSRTFFERCHGEFPKRYGALKRSIYHIRAWGPQSLRRFHAQVLSRAQLSRKGSETRASRVLPSKADVVDSEWEVRLGPVAYMCCRTRSRLR